MRRPAAEPASLLGIVLSRSLNYLAWLVTPWRRA